MSKKNDISTKSKKSTLKKKVKAKENNTEKTAKVVEENGEISNKNNIQDAQIELKQTEQIEKKKKEPKQDINPKIWKTLFYITLGLSGIFLILLIVLIILLNTPPTNIF